MSEWLTGFTSGVFATIIGFILAMLWDFFKFKKEVKRKEEAITTTVQHELNENKIILHHNQILLEKELEILDEKRSVVDPLIPLHSSFWDLLRTNLPFPHKYRSFEVAIKIPQAAQLTRDINETIRSRENYRIHNQAMSNYFSHMKLYDQRLIEDFERLLKVLRELEPLAKETESLAKELVKAELEGSGELEGSALDIGHFEKGKGS